MRRAAPALFPLGDTPDYEPAPATAVGAMADASGITPIEAAYDAFCAGNKAGSFLVYVCFACVPISTFSSCEADEGEVLLLSGEREAGVRSLREALECLADDHAFLLAGDVFTKDQIDGYLALKWEEVYAFELGSPPTEKHVSDLGWEA